MMHQPSEQDDRKGDEGDTVDDQYTVRPLRTDDSAAGIVLDALKSSSPTIADLALSSPLSNEELKSKSPVPTHPDGGSSLETAGKDVHCSSRQSTTTGDLWNGESELQPGSSNHDDEVDVEDENGPPPLVLERQPSASAPKAPGRLAPARTASSTSSNDSSTVPSSAVVMYKSVREIFQPPPLGDRQQGSSSSASKIIPLGQLRKLATAGSLDSSHRGVSWRIMLGYLDPDTTRWPSDLQKKRQLYRDFCRQVFANPIDDGAQLKQQPRRKLSHFSLPGMPNGVDDSSRSASSDSIADNDVTAAVVASGVGEGALAKDASALLAVPALPPPSVPQAVRDAWKRSGRDAHVLESVCSGINALRLPELTDEGFERPCEEFVTTAALLDEIRKDVVRTCSDLSFYLDPALGLRRYAVLERILLISATLSNRAVRYVQGMNEIIAILYFVLTSLDEGDEEDEATPEGDVESLREGTMDSEVADSGSTAFSDVSFDKKDEEEMDGTSGANFDGEMSDWADHAEPDTYWLFHALLSEMTDVFVPDMDSAETGIQGRIAAMQELLKRHDMEVAEHLEEIGIDTGFYAVRWWTTLLSREFRLPDTVRLWDSMFASTHKDNFIRYVCVTMVLTIRDLLLKADFSTCLRMLQSYPPTNMEQLLQSSRALWVYESQITVACRRGGISLHQALQTIAPPPGVVFAFGLRNGMLQAREEDAGTKTTELKVREATQAVASQAQVIFGRARGLYSRSILEYRKYRSTSTTSSANSDAKLNNNDNCDSTPMARSNSRDDLDAPAACPPDDLDDSVYMEAILKA